LPKLFTTNRSLVNFRGDTLTGWVFADRLLPTPHHSSG
jgi:hypothetical protein